MVPDVPRKNLQLSEKSNYITNRTSEGGKSREGEKSAKYQRVELYFQNLSQDGNRINHKILLQQINIIRRTHEFRSWDTVTILFDFELQSIPETI